MALTPPDPKRFMLRDGLIDQQAHRAMDERARAATPINVSVGDETDEKGTTFAALVEEVRRLKQRDAQHEQKIIGLKNLWPRFIKDNWNKSCAAVEKELGFHILGDPLENYFQNGGFKDWNAGVTLPDEMTATGTATLSRVTRRTGARLENYACRITTAGATGGFSQAIAAIQFGHAFTMGFWVYLAGANDTLTVSIATAGAAGDNLAASYLIDAAVHGSGAWFFVPSNKIAGLNMSFFPPADATSCTVTFTAGLNSTVDISDVQVVIGPECNPNIWAPHPADFSDALPQDLATTDSPTFAAATLTGTTPLSFSGSNGTNRQEKYWIEEVTIAAAAATESTTTIPAAAMILGVSVYVTVVIPTASAVDVQDSVTFHSYSNGVNLAVAAGSTTPCMNGLPRVNSLTNTQKIRFVPDLTPAAATGKIRVRVDYVVVTAPTG